MNIDPLRPYADLGRWAAGLLIAVLLIALGYRIGADRWRALYATEVQTSAKHAATLQQLAEATATVAARARAASDALVISRRENDTRFNEALANAKRAETDLAAALRRGSVQLHPQWSCVASGSGAGGAAGDAVKASAAGRANSAARIVGAADADAAVIDWLWNGWKADRDAVLAAGCAVEAPR